MPPMPPMQQNPAELLPQAAMAGDAMNAGGPVSPDLVSSIKSKLSLPGVGFKKPLSPITKKAVSGIKKAKNKLKKKSHSK